MARKVFRWATVAKRPLHVEELREAVAVKPDSRAWNEENLPHEDALFESCRGLIIKDEDDGTVRFAHHTVRQYLTGGLTTKVEPQFGIDSEYGDIFAGQICVTYLSFSDFETQITSHKPIVTLETKGVLDSGGPLWIPSVLGIRKPMFDIPYRLLRGDPTVRSSDCNYWKYLKPETKQKLSPSTNLKEKYRFLSYAIDYWEPHTRHHLPPDSVHRHRHWHLAMYKTLAFEFRPWGSNEHFGRYGCVGCPSPSARDVVAKELPYLSMIHYAAEVGNLALLRYVTGFDDSSLYRPPERNTAEYIHHERYHQETLLIACRHNRVEIVEYLMQGDYDISDGRAVNAAAAAGHAEVLRYILGLDRYPIKQQGDAPVLLAFKNGHLAVVEVLLEAGANTSAYDLQTRRDIIDSAATSGHDSMIRMLGQIGACEAILRAGTSALHLAVANGHVAATQVLLEVGMLNNTLNSDGQTALHIAAESGHTALLEILLSSPGGDWIVYEYDRYGQTPFHLAANGGHVDALEALNESHPIASLPLIASRSTPLHSAAARGQDKAIRWLVEHGADVGAVNCEGISALYFAVEAGKVTTVRVLLGLGAAAYPLQGWGLDTLICASGLGNAPILQMLLERMRGLENIEYPGLRMLDDRDAPIDLFALKRGFIVGALENTRVRGHHRAKEILEQELELYYCDFQDFQYTHSETPR